MTWKTSLAILTAGLLLAAPAAAQVPGGGGSGSGGPTGNNPAVTEQSPARPAPQSPGTPGATTPARPNPVHPGAPSGHIQQRDPTLPCPPGQSKRPGSTACSPTVPTK
jgi:hypothetical protein